MYFCPFILDGNRKEIAVEIEPALVEDLNTHSWQTDWSADYLTQNDFLLYAMKTKAGELGWFRRLSASAGIYHCTYRLYGKSAGQQS